MKKPKTENLVRINTRVRRDQHKFIKTYAKKMGIKEGEAHRAIIDAFMV